MDINIHRITKATIENRVNRLEPDADPYLVQNLILTDEDGLQIELNLFLSEKKGVRPLLAVVRK